MLDVFRVGHVARMREAAPWGLGEPTSISSCPPEMGTHGDAIGLFKVRHPDFEGTVCLSFRYWQLIETVKPLCRPKAKSTRDLKYLIVPWPLF